MCVLSANLSPLRIVEHLSVDKNNQSGMVYLWNVVGRLLSRLNLPEKKRAQEKKTPAHLDVLYRVNGWEGKKKPTLANNIIKRTGRFSYVVRNCFAWIPGITFILHNQQSRRHLVRTKKKYQPKHKRLIYFFKA